MDWDLQTYFPIFIFVLFILAFSGATLTLAHLIGPRKKTPVKEMPYESGMDPIGDARQRFDVKFYLIAILFLVFDVELLFLYPWAVVAYRDQPLLPEGISRVGQPLLPERISRVDQPLLPEGISRVVFWEILVFLLTLVVAYVYAWRKGVFRWR